MEAVLTRIVIVVAMIFALVYPLNSKAEWLYLVDRDTDQLFRIHPDTRESEMIGSLGFNYRFGSMVWHPMEQKLLLVNTAPRENENDPTLADFYWVDPLTANSQLIGTQNLGVTASLAAYGITIDDESRIFVSFTHEDTGISELWEIGLNPLAAQFVLNLGNVGGGVDALEFDPNTGLLLSSITAIRVNPASIYSFNLNQSSVSRQCGVQLPDNYYQNNNDEGPERGFNNGGLTYDPKRDLFWRATISAPLVQLNIDEECTSNPIEQDAPFYKSDSIAYVPGALENFVINSGLNDAWYNPATSGQGLLTAVFPDRKEMFVAWFTYDTERPPDDVTAMLGEPGHRWLTAQGPYNGDTANLKIFVTEGGIFDSATPAASTDPAGDGTMTIEFADCANGLVSYEIASLGISGESPIQRIALDNVALCETLSGQ